MAQKPSIPSGTRDFLPEVMLRREYMFGVIRKVFKKYGYVPIETPAMEDLEVLTGKYGEEGDRLIYKILNSGDFLKHASSLDDAKKLSFEISKKALRYDLTVPFARFVVMYQHALSLPFKRYQIQPVWRADKPQKGRYREFYQCDADVVGSDSLLFEAEYLCMFDEVLSTLGLKDFTIRISNRKILTGFAEACGQPDKFTDICIAIDKWDKVGEQGVRNELLDRGVAASAVEPLLAMANASGTNAEKIAQLREALAASEAGKNGLDELEEVFRLYGRFDAFNGEVVFDPQLARGLDYYTGAIFEVRTNEVKMGSIASGGRYDDLTGVFGKPGLSGVGISLGADRIYDVMEELNLFTQMDAQGTQILLINFGGDTESANLDALNQLRRANIRAELYPEAVKVKKQFGYADKKNIPYTLVIGEAELASGLYQLKNMQTGEQAACKMEEIIDKLSR